MSRARLGFVVACAPALALLACGYEPSELEIPDADLEVFASEVYPILLADCGFTTCHGDGKRSFAIYGPGRTRLVPDTDAYAELTADELALSFARARSMLISPDGPRRAPLLRKPLAVQAGGAEHEGDDPWGEPIYASKSDPRWQTLFFWATTQAAEDDE